MSLNSSWNFVATIYSIQIFRFSSYSRIGLCIHLILDKSVIWLVLWRLFYISYLIFFLDKLIWERETAELLKSHRQTTVPNTRKKKVEKYREHNPKKKKRVNRPYQEVNTTNFVRTQKLIPWTKRLLRSSNVFYIFIFNTKSVNCNRSISIHRSWS